MKIGKMFSFVMLLAAPLCLVAAIFNMRVCAIGSPCEFTYANGHGTVTLSPLDCKQISYYDGYSGVSVKEVENAVFKGWYGLTNDTGTLNVENASVPLCDALFISQEIITSAKKYDGLPTIFPKFVPLRLVETAVEPDGAGSVSYSPESNNRRYEEGSEVTLTATANDGYTFKCWKKKDGSQVSMDVSYTFTVGNTNAIYTAVFEGKKYTLTVHPNGSEDNPAYYKDNPLEQDFIDQLIVGTTNLNSIGVASRVGYEFLGWFSREGGGTPIYNATGYNCRCEYWTEVYPIGTFCGSDDLSVYAGWKLTTSKVTLDNQGGDGGLESVQATFGQLMPTIAEGVLPKKVGYRFAGYYSESEGKGTRYYDEKGTTTSKWDGQLLTLYAHWTEIRCKVTFDANRPSGSCMVSLSTNATEVVPGVPFGTALATAYCEPAFYDFAGWRDKDGNEVTAESIVPEGEEDITLYAHWTTNSYYIAFDGEGATDGEMSVREFKFDTPAALTKNRFEKTGYEFAGWATNIGAEATLSDGAVVSNLLATTKNETNTLYAVWKGHDYKVRFYGNGGTNTMESQAFVYGTPQALSENRFGRKGYTFAGWAMDPTSEVAYGDEEVVSNLIAQAGGEVALYAKWDNGLVITDLSCAADCDNLCLTNANNAEWIVRDYANGEDRVGSNDQYLRTPNQDEETPTLVGTISGSGKLSFYYKNSVGPNAGNEFKFCTHEQMPPTERLVVMTNVLIWTKYEFEKTDPGELTISWRYNASYATDADYACVDCIQWIPSGGDGTTSAVTFRLNDGSSSPSDIVSNGTYVAGEAIGTLPVLTDRSADSKFAGWSVSPEGGNLIDFSWIVPTFDVQLFAQWGQPQPTPDDRREITAMKVSADGLSFGFSNADSRWTYALRGTNELTATRPWPEVFSTNGATGEVKIDVPKPADEPCMFYYLEVR